MSFHIVEEVNVAQSAPDDDKIQVPNQIDDGAGASDCSSLDDDAESLQNELMKLCSEIEKANRVSSGDDDSSSDQEERQLRGVADKVRRDKMTTR